MTDALTGTHIFSLDHKGRVVIPAEFRAAVGAPAVLTLGPNGSLLLMGGDTWDALVDAEGGRSWREYWLSGGLRVEFAADTGRVRVPSFYRQHAGLYPSHDVALSGLGQAVLVQSLARWQAWRAAAEPDVADLLIGRKHGAARRTFGQFGHLFVGVTR